MKAKKAVIAVLMTIGLLAMCGEPAEDFVTTMMLQLAIFATTWGVAVYLAKKWHMLNH